MAAAFSSFSNLTGLRAALRTCRATATRSSFWAASSGASSPANESGPIWRLNSRRRPVDARDGRSHVGEAQRRDRRHRRLQPINPAAREKPRKAPFGGRIVFRAWKTLTPYFRTAAARTMDSPADAQVGTESLVAVPGPSIAPPRAKPVRPQRRHLPARSPHLLLTGDRVPDADREVAYTREEANDRVHARRRTRR